jgi:hypothetical protein
MYVLLVKQKHDTGGVMAIINKLEEAKLEKIGTHTEANCTYSIIKFEGKRFLQIDTYGSPTRQIKDKKSQSMRFSEKAINQLKTILQSNFS